MVRFVRVCILWLWQACGHAPAVRPLVRHQEFRNVEDVVRRKLFVELWFREVEHVMALEPGAQLGRNLEAINKLIARRDRVIFLYFLHDPRVALGEDLKGELAHRFWPRRGRCDARGEFESSGLALRPRPARTGNDVDRDTTDPYRCFSHAKIVTEMKNQKAECTRL